ncbi:caspase family protein [Spirulina sp. 06S082]|uniref:caspase family protein n=1 Tax=Spirulina sp. 06S082 TaxID=3110248 RepID=UPI002B210E36|nr:caspase family protein [Spirulina sp. 06S082]MEA5470639.1 caspase family protein [Spirulina sp. 06S082]
MADYTSIAIGIDRYQFIQPLSYAQDDARAIQHLLLEETGLPAEQALLMTDSSAWLGGKSTQPSKENIFYWLDAWLEKQSTSLLWFFFSGYGVSWQGVDYLMPIDGNPTDIPNTGIPARELFEHLKQKGFDQILALLDINRSPGVIAGEPVGSEIAQFAPEMGISLILSSQLEESSHEAVALGHGIFSAALLEALRYFGQDIVLHDLSGYLYDRLPELSEHHWRPIQHPLIVIPSIELAQQVLLPKRGTAQAAPAIAPITTGEEAAREEAIATEENALASEMELETAKVPSLPDLPPLKTASEANDNGEVFQDTHPENMPQIPAPETEKTPRRPKNLSILMGAGAILLALLAVFWLGRPRPEIAETPPPDPSSSPAIADPDPNALPSPVTTAESPVSAATQNASTAEPQNSTPQNTPATNAATEPPPPLTTEASRSILARARTYIQTNQASGFSRGIEEAQKIQPGAPLYAEAQADISRWSEVILDIARGRAAKGNFATAIAAAKLVPPEQAPTYAESQKSIKLWTEQGKQQTVNNRIIRSARRMVRTNQASSYNKAINELKKVPQGQPGYLQARNLTEGWSRQIYLIANSRAARGSYQQAIVSAKLIPEGTSSYNDAQKAIARWQQGRR